MIKFVSLLPSVYSLYLLRELFCERNVWVYSPQTERIPTYQREDSLHIPLSEPVTLINGVAHGSPWDSRAHTLVKIHTVGISDSQETASLWSPRGSTDDSHC